MEDNTKSIDKLTEQINKINKKSNKQNDDDHIIKIKIIEDTGPLSDTKKIDKIEELDEPEIDEESDTKKFNIIKEEKTEPDEDLKIKIIENTEPPAEPKIVEYKENYIVYYIVIAFLAIIQIAFLYILFK